MAEKVYTSTWSCVLENWITPYCYITISIGPDELKMIQLYRSILIMSTIVPID